MYGRKTARDLEAEFDDLAIEAQAILDKAEADGREPTAPELKRFDAIMDRDNGELLKVKSRLDEAKRYEDGKANLALAMRRNRSEADMSAISTGDFPPSTTTSSGQPQHRISGLRAFRNDTEGAKDAYATGMWLRAISARCNKNSPPDQDAERFLEGRGWNIFAAQTESTATGGGYLVPEPTAATIISIREKVGLARKLCDVVPMTADTQSVPKRTSGLTVYSPGEGNTITTSDSNFGQVKLVAVKRAVANQISNELVDDALISMADRAMDDMAHALALEEDSEWVNGDGTSTYFGEVGLLSAIGSAGVSTPANGGGQSVWTGITSSSISSWKALLPSKFFQKDQMAIVCSSEFYYSVFDRLMNAAGGNSNSTLRTGGLFDDADLQYNGCPVFLTDRMPTATSVSTKSALYGNFQLSSMLGDRTGVRMAMSMDYAFLDDVQTLRAVSRYDLNVHEPGDSSNAGGYVALSTAAS